MSDGHDRPIDSTIGLELVKKQRTCEHREQIQGEWLPNVSVLMPCRNAMPWLPDAVASCLEQKGVRLELIAVDDGSTDGSYEFLKECEELCQQLRSLLNSEPVGVKIDNEEDSLGSGGLLPDGATENFASEAVEGGKLGWLPEHHTPPTAREVAARCLPNCR
jgi:hypothetical protein